MKKLLSVLLALALMLPLCACAKTYTADEIAAIKEAAYNSGYSSGYDDGYFVGYDNARDAYSNAGPSYEYAADVDWVPIPWQSWQEICGNIMSIEEELEAAEDTGYISVDLIYGYLDNITWPGSYEDVEDDDYYEDYEDYED